MSLLNSIWSIGEVLKDSGELQGSSETEVDYRWRARTTSIFGALPCADLAIEGISQTTLERVCPRKRLSEPWCLPNHGVGWVLRLLGNFSLDSKAEKSTWRSPCSRGKRMCLTISQAAFLDDMEICCCCEKPEGHWTRWASRHFLSEPSGSLNFLVSQTGGEAGFPLLVANLGFATFERSRVFVASPLIVWAIQNNLDLQSWFRMQQLLESM